jgi:CheY-like chemotaxis protein
MKTVLIVEDSPSMRTTLDVLLRAKRLRTMLAQNAGDALKLIAAYLKLMPI